MINPNDPANPTTGLEYINQSDQAPTIGVYVGLTIRAELAARFMASTLSNSDSDLTNHVSLKEHAEIAIIEDLNKPNGTPGKESLREAFDAGYDYRSSKDPNIIKEFGENSADGFEAFYKNKTESK